MRLGLGLGLGLGLRGNSNTFVSVWKTDNITTGSSTSTQIALPLQVAGTYNFTVDWGDGSTDTITAWDQAEVTHTYASSGIYTIKIDGQIDGFRFNNDGDRNKILEIKNWGSLKFVVDFGGHFYNCTNLDVTAVDHPDISSLTTFVNMFRLTSLSNYSFGAWDTSSINNMSFMFLQTPNFVGNGLKNWNTSNVTTMAGLFNGTSFNQDISGWDTSKVTSFDQTFRDTPFNQDISGWDTSKATSFQRMFFSCTSFDQDLGSWNVTSLTNAAFMFNGVTLSTSNYDALLVGWEAQAVQNNVSFSGGNSTYTSGSAAATARQALIDDHIWTINDGGSV